MSDDQREVFERLAKELEPNINLSKYESQLVAQDFGRNEGDYCAPKTRDLWKGFKIAYKFQQAAGAEPVKKKVIGWRMENYLYETDDPEQAKNWFGNVEVLPIFEGDINTSLPQPLKAVPDGKYLHDFFSHREAWRDLIAENVRHRDDGYVEHEIKAYDRAFNELQSMFPEWEGTPKDHAGPSTTAFDDQEATDE